MCLLCRYEEEHFLRLSQPGRKRGRRALQEEELTDFSTLKGLTSGERVRLQLILYCYTVRVNKPNYSFQEGHSKKKKLSGRKFGKGRRKKGPSVMKVSLPRYHDMLLHLQVQGEDKIECTAFITNIATEKHCSHITFI